MKRFFKHLSKISKHKFVVFKLCCKCGLVWRGIMHDMSKFSPTEFWESVKYYTDGKSSPINECRKRKGYSLAWIHHVHKNKHHPEYWLDMNNEKQCNMPYKYAVESVCDRIAATKCYNGKNYEPHMVLDYWIENEVFLPFSDNMKNFFTTVLTDLIELGEKKVLNKKYMKNKYKEIVMGRID